jgi:hypothetical protein
MVGDIEWLEFSYYSEEYKGAVKGLHRTQLMLSMFTNLGMIFNHSQGVKLKSTGEVLASKPSEAIEVLNKSYNIKLTPAIMANYFDLIKYINTHLDKSIYDSIIAIYLRILDSTRCDIPEDLQKTWKDRQGELGLTGKFLPPESKLNESKVLPGFKEFLTENDV